MKKKKILYCKVPIVLQLKGLEGLAGLRVFVLQYKLYCRLVRLDEGWLYHNTIECIVGEEVDKALYCWKLYCNTIHLEFCIAI